jgi:hypothetical protein
VLRNDADLIAARPLIASTVSGIVGGGAFRSLFRGAVLDAHRAIFTGDRDTLTLTLADVGNGRGGGAGEAQTRSSPRTSTPARRVVLLKRDIGSLTRRRRAHRRAAEACLAWVLGR